MKVQIYIEKRTLLEGLFCCTCGMLVAKLVRSSLNYVFTGSKTFGWRLHHSNQSRHQFQVWFLLFFQIYFQRLNSILGENFTEQQLIRVHSQLGDQWNQGKIRGFKISFLYKNQKKGRKCSSKVREKSCCSCNFGTGRNFFGHACFFKKASQIQYYGQSFSFP